MEEKASPRVKDTLPLALILAIPGWSLLIYLMTQTLPNLWNRWMFFIAVMVTITGTSMPVITYLNRIIKPFGPATYEMIVRESILLGLYAGILLWLNKGQVLTLGLGLILGIGFILVELALRLRNRTEWHPDR